jgi:hypothetical protein
METSVHIRTKPRYIPEDGNFQDGVVFSNKHITKYFGPKIVYLIIELSV